MICQVCKRYFRPLKENKYFVKDCSSDMIAPVIYEAFDCPYCGCQNKVNPRLPVFDNADNEKNDGQG